MCRASLSVRTEGHPAGVLQKSETSTMVPMPRCSLAHFPARVLSVCLRAVASMGCRLFPQVKVLPSEDVYSSRNLHAAAGSPRADAIHAPPRGPTFCPVSAQADVPPKLVQLMIAAGRAVTMDGVVSSSFMPAEDRGLMPTLGTFPSVCTCP